MYVRADSLQLAALHETEIREELATSTQSHHFHSTPIPSPAFAFSSSHMSRSLSWTCFNIDVLSQLPLIPSWEGRFARR